MTDSEPVRVLCVFSTLDRGGAESMCMNLYRHINRNRVQFDFVKHTSNRGAFEDEIEQLGGRVFNAPRYKIYNQMEYKAWWVKHLRNHPEHNIIHGHFYGISAIYFSVSKELGRATVAHSHSMTTPYNVSEGGKIKNLIKRTLIKRINRYADIRFACSNQAGLDVFGDKGFLILKNAIDASRFRWDSVTAHEVREEFNLGDAFVLGNVSRFTLLKNPYGTLNIFAAVHSRRPNSKLLWVGDGYMRTEIQENATKLGIRDDIVFTGDRSDVERLLCAMDAFCFPSYCEGLGIAAVEAQAAGVRTFCSDTVPIEVNITDLCSFHSVNNIDDWITDLCMLPANSNHPDTVSRIIEAGYDINETAPWLEQLYVSLRA